MWRLARNSAVFGLLLGVAVIGSRAASAASFSVGLNFTGTSRIDELGLGGAFIPPDTMGSVGPNHIVEMINGAYAVYDKTDPLPPVRMGLDDFWIDLAGVTPTGFAFDPRIIYDHDSERWFATSVDNGQAANSILLAVSATSDPSSGWTGFSIDSDVADTRWADFPTMGVDADGVYIAANMFDIVGGPVVSDDVSIFSFPKADLLLPTPIIDNRTEFQIVGQDAGFAIQPAVDFGPSDGRAALLATDFSAFDTLNRTDINNAGGPGPATLSSTTDISVPTTSSPPLAHQPNPGPDTISTGDDRISGNVFEQGDSLWSAHTIDVGGRAAIRWYEIDETDNAVLQSGTISDAQLDLYFPSIAANAAGDVVIGFSGSSDTQAISSYAAVGETSAGTTTFGNIALLKEGNGTYERLDGIGRNRWGDYSATVLDPTNDEVFWTFQEFVDGDDNWAIQITEIQLTDAPPPPGPLGMGGVDGDEQTSIIYFEETGVVAIDAPASTNITAINIASAAAIFTGNPAQHVGGLGFSFDIDEDDTIFKFNLNTPFGDTFLGAVAQAGLSEAFLLSDLIVVGALEGEDNPLGAVDLIYFATGSTELQPLQAGDADQDYDYDEDDITAILAAGKYLLNDGTATWSDGDFDGAAGGFAGSPPEGDGNFDQFDLIDATATGLYLQGDYREFSGSSTSVPANSLGASSLEGESLEAGGLMGDDQLSILYDAATGEIFLDVPDGVPLSSIKIASLAGIFTGDPAYNLGGLFDIDWDNKLFKADLAPDGFTSFSFGLVARPGLSEEFLLADLRVKGSQLPLGGLSTVDLVFVGAAAVPEPATLLILALGLAPLLQWTRRRR